MVTTKIDIKEHLAEFIVGKFGDHNKDIPVRFPDSIELYHTIYDLLEKRPANSIDLGNLEIVLPERSQGKNPVTYNYLGIRSIKIIQKRIETMFWAELHELLDHNKHMEGIEYADTVHVFMCRYSITSITEDALLKNYYRWRDKVRKKSKRREYKKNAA